MLEQFDASGGCACIFIRFLLHTVVGGKLDCDVEQLEELEEEMLEERTTRFFNMEIDGMEAEKEFASFQVKSCSFPGLCAEAGVPEMAPIFCEVDAYFFGGVQRDLILERSTTLAEGGDGCPFHFHWAPEESESLTE